MNDDTLQMLARAAGGVLKVDPARIRRAAASADGFDRGLWRQMADQGWLSILVPESLGGLGLGVAPLAVIGRNIGYAAAPEPFAAAGVFALQCVLSSDDLTAHEGILSGLITGERIASVAWQNAAGSLDYRHTEVKANLTPEGIRLNGACRLVVPASSDVFLLLASADDGEALYLVERDTPGMEIALERTAGGGAVGALSLHDVRLRAADRLVSPSRLQEVMRRAFDLTLVVSAAELLGIMDRVLEMTLEYLRTRTQFNATIGSFQVLQHRAVDMWLERQLTEAAVEAAAARFDAAGSSAKQQSVAASGAKARASQAALSLCNRALQLHGAIGFADEYGLGLYMNRALNLSAWLGNARYHLRRFAELTDPIAWARVHQ